MIDITPTPTQAAAIADIVDWFKTRTQHQQVYRLYGYAGVGKSTIVKFILDELGLSFDGAVPDVVAGTFTAKAAIVLTRFGMPCKTIHKLIYIVHKATKAQVDEAKRQLLELKNDARNAETLDERRRLEASVSAKEESIHEMRELRCTINPESLVREAKLVIVDEVSMVGEQMGQDLESFGKPILVLGDPAQLPPIRGTGYFTAQPPDTMLTEIHRQALENPIIRLSMLAREGRPIPYGRFDDNVAKITKRELFMSASDATPLLAADIVITGKNDTRRMLNNEMRKALGHTSILPCSMDKLICLKNNYELGLINGLFLTMPALSGDARDEFFKARINTEDGDELEDVECYPGHYLDHVAFDKNRDENDYWEKTKFVETTFGNCITVHKAQGSGFECVIVWCDGWGWNPFDRQRWLYTAVTRAVSGLLIVE